MGEVHNYVGFLMLLGPHMMSCPLSQLHGFCLLKIFCLTLDAILVEFVNQLGMTD